jgi:estrogen-related receptor beta like 1
MVPTNPGEQFHMFISLAAWLIRKSGNKFDPPQESDDPNSIISKILEFLQHIDIHIEFSSNKLKQGIGEHAVFVLNSLADHVLKVLKFKWEK